MSAPPPPPQPPPPPKITNPIPATPKSPLTLTPSVLKKTVISHDASTPNLARFKKAAADRAAAGKPLRPTTTPTTTSAPPTPTAISLKSLYNILCDVGLTFKILDVRSAQAWSRGRVKLSTFLGDRTDNVDELAAAARQELALAGITFARCIIVGDGDSVAIVAREAARDSVAAKLRLIGTVSSDVFEQLSSTFPFLMRTDASSSALDPLARPVKYPSLIVDTWLYLGAAEHAKDPRVVADLGITHILNMADELENAHDPSAIVYFNGHCDDNEGQSLRDKVADILAFFASVKRAGGVVLCHCAMGISRSSAAVIAYLMATDGIPYDEAASQVRAQRSIIRPNPGFEAQLREMEAELIARASA
uniref:Protein-serine/threonine phosphatase n=1 Tax=Sexangularia sp. CB-2014 TaxID=1486929 RepID=A0A7S1YJI2_9EUKA|mmetsp:Transcript_7834/g.25106  ORF Transcript_7834/g.25106 Transcript_7834/m.25106 type:complete len:363 (+) Transcript_7834:127-1215(+)|eukprot:CAMPEP_0170747564 /NCGR_PEP_ID=MMETSP0437-20130122/9387_1 /TAXON_ID=0 /ORGANISM="Sexangularia sp." /LENGTH=362 /DNA_ID=CAMNT_0011086345 /DNA_START=41 /DNA_END=1129 /DNA_ORIENTATION=-